VIDSATNVAGISVSFIFTRRFPHFNLNTGLSWIALERDFYASKM